MFSAPQLHPAIIYSTYLVLLLTWLVFVWLWPQSFLLFIGSGLLVLLGAVLLSGVIRKYRRQVLKLNKTNRELKESLEVLKSKMEEAILAEQVIDESTNTVNQQNSYLLSLHAAALALMNRRNLEDILENIVENAVKLASEADAFISLADSSGDSLITKAGTGCFKESIGSRILLTDEIGGQVFRTGEAVVLNSLEPHLLSDFLRPKFKALAVVPLKSGQQVVGMIGLGYYKETLLSQLELEFLEGLAALASSAVDNARLYEKVQYELKERKLVEENLKYISIHDPLTGLYNRIYFEEEMRRLSSGRFDPVGIVVCDVDGLKLVNDSLGHIPGDELLQAAAGIIEKCFRENDVIARIGGDEFAVLLPNSDVASVERAYQRIMRTVLEYNTNSTGFLLSISVGFACKDSADTDLHSVFQLADDAMYRKKMQNRKNTREALIQSIRGLLDSKSFLTGENSERLYDLVIDLAKRAGMSSLEQLTSLRLLAEFHDIGKVGIPDGILVKSEPLTNGELSEIRRHSEIGYRIAKVLPELLPIADCILKHHEWWNGQGYPFGIAGEEIPLECRIWAIADAYDAMISERPYREALTSSEAVAEIVKGAGSQFDPELVNIFVKMIEEQK